MPKKRIPKFKNEDAERAFWARANATNYFDMGKARTALFPNLKPSSKTISLRLPASLLEHLRILANQRDVAYQSLIKVFLAERIREELALGRTR